MEKDNYFKTNVETKNYSILVFMSECLAAKSIFPLIEGLSKIPNIDIRIVNDGFGKHLLEESGLQFEHINIKLYDRLEDYVLNSDMILSGKSYLQPAENYLMQLSLKHNVLYLMLIPDIGGQIAYAKFNQNDSSFSTLLPTFILLSDEITHSYMVDKGIPVEKLIKIGSPYFDTLYRRLFLNESNLNKKFITYMDVPFELDYSRGVLPLGYYSQKNYIDEITSVIEGLDLFNNFKIKKHMQSDDKAFSLVPPSNFYNNNDSFSLILESSLVISPYSTTLLEAYVAGVPAISYQPWEGEIIREDVFKDRIPIVKDKVSLSEKIKELFNNSTLFDKPNILTYNPYCSADAFINFINLKLGETHKKNKIL
jgi:glycosyltransferase involved in cell wall biosynthesis